MEVRGKLSKLVALPRRMGGLLNTYFGLVYFSCVLLISTLPAAAALTLAWNYAIVGMFTFTAGVGFLEIFVLLACIWVIMVFYFFINAYGRFRIWQWQVKKAQKSMGQQVQAEAGLMKHFNRGNPT